VGGACPLGQVGVGDGKRAGVGAGVGAEIGAGVGAGIGAEGVGVGVGVGERAGLQLVCCCLSPLRSDPHCIGRSARVAVRIRNTVVLGPSLTRLSEACLGRPPHTQPDQPTLGARHRTAHNLSCAVE
jgi:hypothetical protein